MHSSLHLKSSNLNLANQIFFILSDCTLHELFWPPCFLYVSRFELFVSLWFEEESVQHPFRNRVPRTFTLPLLARAPSFTVLDYYQSFCYCDMTLPFCFAYDNVPRIIYFDANGVIKNTQHHSENSKHWNKITVISDFCFKHSFLLLRMPQTTSN